jgi:hypothetical protein
MHKTSVGALVGGGTASAKVPDSRPAKTCPIYSRLRPAAEPPNRIFIGESPFSLIGDAEESESLGGSVGKYACRPPPPPPRRREEVRHSVAAHRSAFIVSCLPKRSLFISSRQSRSRPSPRGNGDCYCYGRAGPGPVGVSRPSVGLGPASLLSFFTHKRSA